MPYKPVLLMILDGWGMREMEHGNATRLAKTPNYTRWSKTLERAVLDASGEAVGLVAEQMGNSEVGHLNLGAGRIVYQDIAAIDQSIRTNEFFQLPLLLDTLAQVKAKGGKLHIMGLLGTGGVHAHDRHLYALLDMCRRHSVNPLIHVITDGRDTAPGSAVEFIRTLEDYLASYEMSGVIASLSGRYYAMDRDKRWERTNLAYQTIALHQGDVIAPSASAAVAQSLAKDVGDEFILPTVIDVGAQNVKIEPGDAMIFYNFRADRMRQITRMFTHPEFDGRPADAPFIPGVELVSFTHYADDLPTKVAFPNDAVKMPLAEVLSYAGKKQFHIAETEKYPHVTFFFNGRRETPFEGEDRTIVPSPKVATYDLQPEMSAYELTATILERLRTHDDDFLLINYANPDMVGHTGSLEAAIKAVETVDECANRVVEAVVAKGGVALVTADHGNSERMINELTGEPHTYHTTNPVALYAISKDFFLLRPRGILADVAPTVLDLLGIPQPSEMTGRSLITTEL